MGLLDSTLGQLLAGILHTARAIGFLAGAVLYVAWARGARRGDTHANLLMAGAALTYISVLANLLGGFIRTYQPGHPKAWELFSEPWAMAMVVKHLFLFAGMFGAVYLYEVQAPRLRKAVEAGAPYGVQRNEATAVGAGVVAVVVATLLGALAASPVLGVGAAGPAATDVAGGDSAGDVFQSQTYTASGSGVSGAPPTTGTFAVDPGATSVDGYLYTSTVQPGAPTPFVYTLTLRGPDGAAFTGQSDLTRDLADAELASDVYVTVDAPLAGQWTFEVRVDQGILANWELTLSVAGPEGLHLMDVADLADGDFLEINTIMDRGAEVHWDWSVASGTALPFNVHLHEGGEVTYPVEGRWSAHNGTYTAERDGGVSLMWENDTGTTQTVRYHVWGDFALHSIV